jgi:hypothetical protein
MDAMRGSPSPCRVFAKTPMHASDRAESEYVSVEVKVIDMLLMLESPLLLSTARTQHYVTSNSSPFGPWQ